MSRSNLARVVFPLEEHPLIPITIALSLLILTSVVEGVVGEDEVNK